MILLSFVLSVIFSAECTIGALVSPVNSSLADKAFKLLQLSLYCAPNGTFVYHDPTLGWLHFDSETVPSKYRLLACNECPECIGKNCRSCVPRPLGAFCGPCAHGKPWPSAEDLLLIAPRCLGCLFDPPKIKVKPCTNKPGFNWLGWLAGMGRDALCALDNSCGERQPKQCHSPPCDRGSPASNNLYPPPPPPPQNGNSGGGINIHNSNTVNIGNGKKLLD